MLKTIVTDRRVWLAILILGLVAVVSRWALPAKWGFTAVIESGYWFMLALTVLFGRAAWALAKGKDWRRHWVRFDAWVAALIVGTVVVWVAHERPGYKILADEALLSGTAMSMHYDRAAAYPVRATDVQGSFQILTHMLDKRPLLFPFLLATVHDATGYRPENAFYLNIALSAVFLALIYVLATKAGGSRWAGVVAVLLFAGLPLMAQQATGGGFELLNLLLLAAFGLLLIHYLEAPDESRLEAFILGALLLASTRYESAVFLAAAAGVALIGWWRARRVLLTWPLILSPLFLLPLLLQNRMFVENTQVWQMAGQTGVSEPFGLQYLAPNMGHALAFFFDFSGYQPSSPLFAAAGLVTLPFFGLWMMRVLRQGGGSDGRDQALALFGVSLFAVTAVYMFYFWGKFDDPIISRLSLPVHLLMMLSVALICGRFIKSDRGWKLASALVLAGILTHGLPVLSKQAYRSVYSPGVEMQLRQEFLSGQEDRNLLLIDNDSFYWILNKVSSSPVVQVKLRKDALAYHLRNHSFREMYVFQRVKVDDATGRQFVDPVDDLGSDFELEPVWERRVQTLLFARISRVKAIKEGGNVLAEARTLVPVLKETRTSDELEKARVLYMEKWLKQLP